MIVLLAFLCDALFYNYSCATVHGGTPLITSQIHNLRVLNISDVQVNSSEQYYTNLKHLILRYTANKNPLWTLYLRHWIAELISLPTLSHISTLISLQRHFQSRLNWCDVEYQEHYFRHKLNSTNCGSNYCTTISVSTTTFIYMFLVMINVIHLNIKLIK